MLHCEYHDADAPLLPLLVPEPTPSVKERINLGGDVTLSRLMYVDTLILGGVTSLPRLIFFGRREYSPTTSSLLTVIHLR